MWRSILPLFEIALVRVRLDHVACFIVNANHSAIRAAAMHRVADCAADRVRFAIQKATEWQRIGNEIEAAMIFARAKFVHFADWLPPNADHLFDVSEINRRSNGAILL
jgi:hypothetical protein